MDANVAKPPRRHARGPIRTLIRAARRARLEAFDRRTVAGRLLYEARQDFVAHIGGEDELSAAEAALVERLAMRRLVLALVDEMLLKTQGTGTPRDVLEVARQLAALDAGYVTMLKELGWKRKAKPVPSLAEYVSKKDAASKTDSPICPSSESRLSSGFSEALPSLASEEMPKKDAPPGSRGKLGDGC